MLQMFPPFLTISWLRCQALGPWPRVFLTAAREELGSWISLLVSHVRIISGAQAAPPLCSGPHAALHHCLAMILSPGAGSLTCAGHTSVMAYISTALYWQSAQSISARDSVAPPRAIMYKPNHLD